MESGDQQEKECYICGAPIKLPHYNLHLLRCQKITKSSSPQKLQASSEKKLVLAAEPEAEESSEETIPCPYCGYMMKFPELDVHPMLCVKKDVICLDCNGSYPPDLIDQHRTLCERREDNQRRRARDRRNIMPARFSRRRDVFAMDEDEDEESSNWMQSEPSYQRFLRPRPLSVRYHPHRNIFHNPHGYSVLFLSSDFLTMIRVLAQRYNLNDSQGLSKEQIDKIPQEKYKKSPEGDKCSICYCDFTQEEMMKILSCKHFFHVQCIVKWLQINSTCPLCKKDFKEGGIGNLLNDDDDEDEDFTASLRERVSQNDDDNV